MVSADGTDVWVSARGSDAVLAFDAAVLRTGSTHARPAEVAVGPAPVAPARIDRARYLVVTDSDRFSPSTDDGDVRAVEVAAALAHRPAVVARVSAGSSSRDVALEPGGHTLLVANYDSGQIQAIDTPLIGQGGEPTPVVLHLPPGKEAPATPDRRSQPAVD